MDSDRGSSAPAAGCTGCFILAGIRLFRRGIEWEAIYHASGLTRLHIEEVVLPALRADQGCEFDVRWMDEIAVPDQVRLAVECQRAERVDQRDDPFRKIQERAVEIIEAARASLAVPDPGIGDQSSGGSEPQEGEDPESAQMGEWLKIAEGARISGINRGTIMRAADDGRIEDNGVKGKARRIRASSFSAWVLARPSAGEESDLEVAKKMRKAGL